MNPSIKKEYTANKVGIELHYNFIDNSTHSINFYTRNTCSVAQVEIVSYIIATLYPNEMFEIVSLPAQDGSFKDFIVVKFLNKNAGVVSVISSAVTLLLPALLFSSQLQLNKTTTDINKLQIIEKCKNFGLDEEEIRKVEEICDSYIPKKQKNIFYESIASNKDIASIKPTITENSTDTFTTEIEKEDFKNYIEEIPKEKEFLKTDLSGHIQLSQPFIDKQQQYGRGVAWKGTYYGSDVLDENNDLVIADGENVFFYMQDMDYKTQILNQEIKFASGDNISVIFDVSRYYDYVNRKYGGPRLYVKKVVSHNDNLVQHKKELALKKEKQKLEEKNKNQGLLFSDIQQ
jgi:hypothetical protein